MFLLSLCISVLGFPFKSDVVDTSYKQMEQGAKSIESEHDLAHSLLYEPFKLGNKIIHINLLD